VPQPPLDPALARQARDAIAKHGGATAAARATGIAAATLRSRAQRCQDNAPADAAPIAPAERREIIRLRAENEQLRRAQHDHDGEALLAEAIAAARGRLQAEAVEAPSWALRGERAADSPGVPMLMLTDWHVGETVRASEVFRLNQFDAAAADARVRQVVERAVMLGAMHAPAGGHRGGVVFLGGDFVSGWLHEELVRSDWCSPLQSAAWCVSRLVWVLRKLRDAWGRIYVVGVSGNHGRLTKRPPGKGHSFQCFDWLIYTMVAQQLHESRSDRKTITVSVPDDGEQIVQVAGTRYHLMHGHQLGVKGGDGIIGALGPIMRGAVKIGSANRSVGRDSDVLVIGHYHQTLWLPRVIVGGTLKGFDEYARVSRFSFEPASQLMWFSHPKWGANCPMRVFLQDPATGDPAACVTKQKAA
jgi:predicted phosphodiesterase